jgi:DNA-binding winged helix-turn-helix (wHTH) protein
MDLPAGRKAAMKTGRANFTLDEPARLFRRGSEAVHLSPKAFDLLTLLVRRRPDAVSKAAIHGQLWPDVFVSDVNLAVLVGEIRAAFGEDAHHGASIRTVHRYGYAFAGTLTVIEAAPAFDEARPVCEIAWRDERVELVHGKHVIGRDPAAAVRVDAPGVSRRHAIIEATGDVITLGDLSSKNGTFVDGVRVGVPVALTRDVTIRLGPEQLRFMRRSADASTETWDRSGGNRG